MALTYSVKRAFAHEGTYYTRGNADLIVKLPRDVRDDRIERGYITEHDDRKGDPAAPVDTPSAAAGRGGK